jgi:hypothetical protein
MNKALHIPTAFREWHGEFAPFHHVVLVNAIGIAAACTSLFHQDLAGLQNWGKLIIALSLFDLAGGLVSQFTPGTSSYFELHKLRFIPVFLTQLVHIWAVSLIPNSTDAVFFMLPAFLVGFTLVFVSSEINKLLISSCIGVVLLITLFSPAANMSALSYLLVVLFLLKNILATPIFWNRLSN